jgi:hypothetical protein
MVRMITLWESVSVVYKLDAAQSQGADVVGGKNGAEAFGR